MSSSSAPPPETKVFRLPPNCLLILFLTNFSTKKFTTFYSKYVKGKLHATNARTAEMCKLVENSSRDAQIAFANELSMVAHQAEVNIWELIDLINLHPRVNVLQPGPGVGGHCIPVDPYFLTYKAKQLGVNTKFIKLAGQINDERPIEISNTIG